MKTQVFQYMLMEATWISNMDWEHRAVIKGWNTRRKVETNWAISDLGAYLT